MTKLERTTITIPTYEYRNAKLLASAEDKSFSEYVTDLIRQKIKITQSSRKSSKKKILGAFSSKKNINFTRSDLYEERIKKQISN